MEYYSKTPKQLRDDLAVVDQKKKKKRRWSRLIILIDIVLIVLLFFYLVNYKGKSTEDEDAADLKNLKNGINFIKNQYEIGALCTGRACSLQLKLLGGKRNNEKNPAEGSSYSSNWQSIKWQLVGKNNADVIFESTAAIKLKDGLFRDEFISSVSLEAYHKVYALIFDEKRNEVLRFRVHPGLAENQE